MKRLVIFAAAAAICCSPAEASFLKNLARQGAAQLGSGAAHQESSQQPAKAAPAGTAPQPVRTGAPTAAAPRAPRYTSEIPVPPEAKSAKAGFDSFGETSCSDCEGGHGYDSWIQQFLNFDGYNGFAAKVGTLPTGGSLHWRGQKSDGTLAVIGETELSGFHCKQVRYTLTHRLDHQSAERPGLFCLGRSNGYAASDSWNEVY